MHCPGTAEKCQVPETDCEIAVEVALDGTVDPQTSATQESPEGTYPESQAGVSETSERVPKEQENVPETAPLETAFETVADPPLESSGTE